MADSLPILTTSERSTFKQCPQKWHWRYVDGLVRPGESPDALWFGIGVHEALAAWYLKGIKRGPHPAETFATWVGKETRFIRAAMTEREQEWYDEPLYEEARTLGVAMLEGYVDRWGRDLEWDVLYIETPFKVRIARQGKPIGRFWSTFDGVYRNRLDGSVWLMEHKTASSIDTAYLEIDDQGGSYFAVATDILRARGVLGLHENIEGITYNFLRKSMPDDRPKNELGESLNQNGTVSKKQPVPHFVRHTVERAPAEVRTQMARMADEMALMNAVREGSVPLTKTPTKMCPRTCEFWTLCGLHERGSMRAVKAMMESTFTSADPYGRYRKSAGG